MATLRHLGLGLFGLVLIGTGLGSFSCSSVETAKCVPGKSTACTGPQGCQGYQVCKADGASFDACNCDSLTSSSTSTGSTGTGAGGGASSSSTGSSSSSGTGGSGGAGSFTPADLPGLVLWLDDDKGVVEDPQHAGTMLRWLDQSGNGNDATAVAVQDGFRFDIDPAVIHGHDGFKCHGGGPRLEVPDAASLQFGTGDYAVAVVSRRVSTSDQNQHGLFQKDAGAGGLFVGVDSDYRLREVATSVAIADPDPTKFHVLIARGPALDLHLDTLSATGPVVTSNIDEVTAPVRICLSGTQNEQEIAEVIAVKGKLSDANLAKLQGYFQTKFNL